MWLLAVDTSGRGLSVALYRDRQQVSLLAPPNDQQHSVVLFRTAQQMLGDAGLALADIDLYAAATGPGAFTGLRVGLTFIKGLAEVFQKPVMPVSVLAAVCELAEAGGVLVPIVDAYRGQVFGGLYEKQPGELHSRGPERVLEVEEFLAQLLAAGVTPEKCTLVGRGLERWARGIQRTPFHTTAQEVIPAVLAAGVARRALAEYGGGAPVDALQLEANYVRRSDAELLWKEK